MKRLRETRRRFRKLLDLGVFDERGVFRCSHANDEGEASRLISELVYDLVKVQEEWRTAHDTIQDLRPEEIIRVVPEPERAFFEQVLLPKRDPLITTDVINRIRWVREKYLVVVNLQSFDSLLRNGVSREQPDRANETCVLLHHLTGSLEDLEEIECDFPEAAQRGFQFADPDGFARNTLLARREALRKAIPQWYWDHSEPDPNDQEACLANLTELQARVAAHHKHRSPFPSYGFRLLDELFEERPDKGVNDAPGFLDSLVSWWVDSVEDESRSFKPDWVARGRRAMPILERLASSPATFRVATKGFFQPEKWLDNLAALPPVALHDHRLPSQGRQLLQQVYASLVFGQWSAVFALSRAVLEYVVKERLKALGVPAYEIRRRGRNSEKKVEKSLEVLVDDLLTKRGDLRDLKKKFDEIRDQGNRALHQAVVSHHGNGVVEADQRFRGSAVEIVRSLKCVVEAIYNVR